MLARSAAFDNAIISGARVVTSCAVTRAGQQIAAIDMLPGATVTLDDSAACRRNFSAQLADTGIAPHLPTDPLAPFGIEYIPQVGLVTPAQPAGEMIPLGVFVGTVAQDNTTGAISLSGQDRAFKVARNLNEAPVAFKKGTPLDTAIAVYLNKKLPGTIFLPDGDAHQQTLASAVVFQTGTASGDPFSNMLSLAAQFGRELFFDAYGRLVLRPFPSPASTAPVWTYAPGTANLALSGTHTMDTTENPHNVFVVSGEGTGVKAPVTGTFEVTDPRSPIFPSPAGFGRRPLFMASPHMTTAAQCAATAAGLYQRQPGTSDQFQFTAIPHPCHEPGDVVSYSSQLLGVQVNLVLASWQLQIDLQTASQYNTRTAGDVAEQVITDRLNATLTG